METKKYVKRKRHNYTPELLQIALDDIRSGTPINTASRKFNIPRATLHSKIIKKYVGKKRGPDPVLSLSEEKAIAEWILYMCTIGRPVTKEHVVNSATLIIEKSKRPNPFTDGRPGRQWYEGFLRRNKELVEKIRNTIPFQRMVINEDLIRKWFLETTNLLESKKLKDIDSTRVFNIGETVLFLNNKDDFNCQSGKTKARILLTGNAQGQLAPTLIAFNNQQITDNLYDSLPDGWYASVSEKGFITAKIFYEYIEFFFYPWLIKNEIQLPVIIYIDGCVSYLTQSLHKFCQSHQLEIIILPPNVTQFMQPIDVSLIRPLKVCWEKCINIHKDKNNVLEIRSDEFGFLLADVFMNMDIIGILANGFRWCGLFPLSVEQIIYTKPFIERRQIEEIEQLVILQEKEQSDQSMFHELETIQPIIIQNSHLNHQSTLLQALESYIDSEKLDIFRSAIHFNEWLGKPEDMNLFYTWRNILNDNNSVLVIKTEPINVEKETNTNHVHSINIHLGEKIDASETTGQYKSRIIDNKSLNLVVDLVLVDPNDDVKNIEVDLIRSETNKR